jgi:hypothetical protein
MINRLKWALIAFQDISDLKINLSTSELVLLNLDPAMGQYLARILSCSIGKLPLNYLGVKLHWKNLLNLT